MQVTVCAELENRIRLSLCTLHYANSTFRMLYHANHGNPVGSIKSGSFYRSPTTGCQTSLSYDNRRILVYYSAGIFKRPTHCLTTTFTSRIPGQRRLDL